MPKLYEYFGLIVMFYANEHQPIHAHDKCQGRESRVEIILINGMIQEICYTSVAGRAPLDINEMRFFQELVSSKANEIIAKWIDFLYYTNPLHLNVLLGGLNEWHPHQYHLGNTNRGISHSARF